jgi:Mrp family chromosome partitioning ATPase
MEPKMGKMLEVFKQSNPKVTPRTEAPRSIAAPEPIPAPVSDDNSPMPFIEVGGKNDKMEASADVLACAVAVKPVVRPPAPPRALESKPTPGAGTPRLIPAFRGVRLQQPVAASPQWVFFSPRFAAEVIVAHELRHAVCAQYEELLGQILGALRDRPSSVICFLGAAEQCGTTTAVLNLALTAARSTDQSVTVIDANRRRPALAQRIGLDTDKVELAWHQARKPANLRFVPWVDRTHMSLASVLELLRADEGLIFLDGPNLNDVRDELADLHFDALYVVAANEERRSPTVKLDRAIDGWIVAQ